MKTKVLKSIRNTLQNVLQKLAQETETCLSISEHEEGIPGSMDLIELAAFQYAREVKIKIQNRNRQLAWEVQDALRRIDSGEFGICEVCGNDIELNRLRVQPMARMCVYCKRKQEAKARLDNTGTSKSIFDRCPVFRPSESETDFTGFQNL